MKNNSIQSVIHNECCGCNLCGDCCPKQAISFTKDLEGFSYPIVDESTCIDCGICLSKCPGEKQEFNEASMFAYACFAKDKAIKKLGSSGGIFGLVAKRIIKQGGKVWGSSFDECLKLRHIVAIDEKGLEPIYKSKYLQSDCSGVYKKIKKDLLRGVTTLFCGTPCQCSALKNLVGENENLFLIDFVCHGVPSQDLFDKNIDWLGRLHGGKCIGFKFRYTGKEMKHPQAFSYEIRKGMRNKTFSGLHYQNPFYFAFQRHISLRPSCYSCKYSSLRRCSDLTLGDFWGIEKYCEFDSKEGVSMVLPNTLKGDNLFEEVSNRNLVERKEFRSNIAVENNPCLRFPTKMPQMRGDFFKALVSEDYDKVVKEFMIPKKKIIFDLYYAIPKPLRQFVRKLMDKRMKYE